VQLAVRVEHARHRAAHDREHHVVDRASERGADGANGVE